ncbi:multicopper oxidase family protein [Pseudonocardia sp. RS11V-5]|uniref:multicopper oxidase family protein n=1 Tax=Pseudonocardia terrae TaxID=2905831 RepID=UPI001E57FD0A|nr:multicopper oxidase family protein [Pseudonocardia terrae]MCE3553169.1 multicopper oxidase family protein [Pseudonocardia terrae]
MNPRPISRRRALVLGGAGVAALAAGAAGWISTAGSPAAGTTLDAGATREPLAPPAELTARDGRLQVELVAATGVRLAGRDTRALGFNGTSPGPTLRLRPGDELAVRLTNHLDQPTNLHTHGLRVSPQGNSDNPFLRIDPGASFDYRIPVPPDHPPGTHWYHPHYHGTVADQLFGGLAGALLVDGGPPLPVDDDRVLLITDTTLNADGTVPVASPAERMQGREGQLVLLNGQHQPVVSAAPGHAQRWRLINGCISRVLAVRLEGHTLQQIAQDSTFLPAPTPHRQLVLAPGNRADVVVQPDRAGRFTLLTDPYDRGTAMSGMGGTPPAATGSTTLATLAVDGPAATAPALPTTLPAEPPPAAATATRSTAFQMGMGGMRGGTGNTTTDALPMSFTIDGRSFDPNRDDQIVTAGTVEEWTVTNTGPLAHPFHLHVWPFTVVAASDGRPTTGVPQDVVLVPATGWVRLRIPFTSHTGRSVYHCHILDHEDAGMMATIVVR